MKLSDLIKQLLVLEAKHGPDLEVLLSVDDSYWGLRNHRFCGAVEQDKQVLLTDVCSYHDDPNEPCPGRNA